MKIRMFEEHDTDALVAIWRAASALAHPFLSESFIAREADDLKTVHLRNAETWVIEEYGQVLGFIALIGDEIGGLFVDPSRHGKGLGRKLVDHARANRERLRVEVFEKNAIGRRFYARYGFVETGRYRHADSGEILLRSELPAIE